MSEKPIHREKRRTPKPLTLLWDKSYSSSKELAESFRNSSERDPKIMSNGVTFLTEGGIVELKYEKLEGHKHTLEININQEEGKFQRRAVYTYGEGYGSLDGPFLFIHNGSQLVSINAELRGSYTSMQREVFLQTEYHTMIQYALEALNSDQTVIAPLVNNERVRDWGEPLPPRRIEDIYISPFGD